MSTKPRKIPRRVINAHAEAFREQNVSHALITRKLSQDRRVNHFCRNEGFKSLINNVRNIKKCAFAWWLRNRRWCCMLLKCIWSSVVALASRIVSARKVNVCWVVFPFNYSCLACHTLILCSFWHLIRGQDFVLWQRTGRYQIVCLCGSELVWGSSQIVAVAVDCLFPVVSSLWFCVWF